MILGEAGGQHGLCCAARHHMSLMPEAGEMTPFCRWDQLHKLLYVNPFLDQVELISGVSDCFLEFEELESPLDLTEWACPIPSALRS